MHSKFKLRHIIQAVFFTLIFLTAINHSLSESGITIPLIGGASIHALCPFGAVVSFYQLLTTGSFVKKIHESAMVLFSITLFLSILVGPVFCSWICPLGSLQEWVSSLGRRLGLHGKFNVSSNLDKKLGLLRYVVLLWVIYVTARSGELIFTNYDPYYALFNFWSGEVALSALLILGLTLMLALFIERPWCKYTCPFGALLGLANIIRIFKIRRNKNTCIDCQKCDATCPMNIEISGQTSIKDPRCISCLNCTSQNVCPIPQTVELSIRGDHNETS